MTNLRLEVRLTKHWFYFDMSVGGGELSSTFEHISIRACLSVIFGRILVSYFSQYCFECTDGFRLRFFLVFNLFAKSLIQQSQMLSLLFTIILTLNLAYCL